MKLTEIEINGFKSYGMVQEAIPFGDVNIIIGPNGAGKSNMIAFLEMISFIATDGLGEYVARNGYASSLIYARREKIDHIEGKLRFTDGTFKDSYEIQLKQGAGGDLFISNEKILYKAPDLVMPYEREYRAAGKRSALLDATEQDKTSKVILGILKGCRIFHFNNTTMSAKMRMPGYIQDNHYLRADGGNLAAYLYRLKNDSDLKDYYQRIVNMIKEVFPRFDGFSLHPQIVEGGSESISLNWREKGCDEVFGPHMLSDGTLRFIALCTLLLKPDHGQSNIIILDEPEIGLHPYAVRVLAEMMRMASKDVQIIAATQSKELMDAFSADDIIVAEYDQINETSRLKRLSEEKLKDWLEEYTLADLWDKNIIGGTP